MVDSRGNIKSLNDDDNLELFKEAVEFIQQEQLQNSTVEFIQQERVQNKSSQCQFHVYGQEVSRPE